MTNVTRYIFLAFPVLVVLAVSNQAFTLTEEFLLENGATYYNTSIVLNNQYSWCKITDIEQGTFLKFFQLGSLIIIHNQLTELDASIFEGLTNLKLLNCGFNMVANIQPGAFEGLFYLQLLDLSNSMLSSLPAQLFTGLHNLQLIRLNFNRLASIDAGAFSQLSQLQEIDLSYNQLSNLSSHSFANLPTLKTLRLSYNSVCVAPNVSASVNVVIDNQSC